MKSPSPLRIAVSGYYGFGNTGDEAVLAGIVEAFRRRAGEDAAQFTVFSSNPTHTQRLHGLSAVDRMSASALKQTLRESDLLVSGGGSLLQDTTSLRSLLYYLWVVRLALKARTPVMFYAQGIGPLRRASSRMLTRLVANRVQQITVRDPGSETLLRNIGVRRPPITITADPAFALRSADEAAVDAILTRAEVPLRRPLVGVALRPWHTPFPAVPDYAAACRKIIQTTGAHLVFFPMQPPGDVELSVAIAEALGENASVLKEPLSPPEAVGVAGRFDALLAMRLHALIFGAVTGVPLAALSYDPKVTELMARIGQQGRTLDLAALSPENVSRAVAEALEMRDAERAGLRARAGAMEELALSNVDTAFVAAGRELPPKS